VLTHPDDMTRTNAIWRHVRRGRRQLSYSWCETQTAGKSFYTLTEGEFELAERCFYTYQLLPITLTSDLLIQPIKSHVEHNFQPRDHYYNTKTLEL
jgi:hypothetical protein